MRRLLMSRLIMIATVCLVIFLFQQIKYETNKVAVLMDLSSEVIRLYPTLLRSIAESLQLSIHVACWHEEIKEITHIL